MIGSIFPIIGSYIVYQYSKKVSLTKAPVTEQDQQTFAAAWQCLWNIPMNAQALGETSCNAGPLRDIAKELKFPNPELYTQIDDASFVTQYRENIQNSHLDKETVNKTLKDLEIWHVSLTNGSYSIQPMWRVACLVSAISVVIFALMTPSLISSIPLVGSLCMNVYFPWRAEQQIPLNELEKIEGSIAEGTQTAASLFIHLIKNALKKPHEKPTE